MKKHFLSLVVLLFFLFSFSSVSYAEIVKCDDGKSYLVTGQSDRLSNEVISGDLYILKDCSLTTADNVSIFGNVYVFGSLSNRGTLRVSADLYCLSFISGGFHASAEGVYTYGIVTSTGKFYANQIIAKRDYLGMTIPSATGSSSGEPEPEKPVHVHNWQKEYSYKTYCTDTGTVRYRCSECGETKSETVGPENHNFGDWTIMNEPTCRISGSKTRSCNDCFYYETVSIPATGVHTMGNWFTVQPTCTTAGSRSRSCIRCNYEERVNLPATGIHSYGPWSQEEKATAYVAGRDVRYCSTCGTPEYRTVAKVNRKITKDEKNVKKVTDTFFKYLKKYDIKRMKKCFATPKKVKLFASKKNVAKYIRKHNKSFWYQIRDIKVSKKTAIITVSCNYFNAYDNFQESFDDVLHYMGSKKRSGSAVDKYQYKRLLYYDKYYADYSDSTFTIKLKKVRKSWKLANPSKALYNAMHCNYTQAYDDFF